MATTYVSPALFPAGSIYPVDLYAESNIALTGTVTVDGVSSGTNLIAAFNQTDPAEKGIYTAAASGAWTLNVLLTALYAPFSFKPKLGTKYANHILVYNGVAVVDSTPKTEYKNAYTVTNLASGVPQEITVTFTTPFLTAPTPTLATSDSGLAEAQIKSGTLTTTGCTVTVTSTNMLANIPSIVVYATFE